MRTNTDFEVDLTHDHLAAFGGNTMAKDRYLRMLRAATFHACVNVEFLRTALHEPRGEILIIGSGSAVHKGGQS